MCVSTRRTQKRAIGSIATASMDGFKKEERAILLVLSNLPYSLHIPGILKGKLAVLRHHAAISCSPEPCVHFSRSMMTRINWHMRRHRLRWCKEFVIGVAPDGYFRMSSGLIIWAYSVREFKDIIGLGRKTDINLLLFSRTWGDNFPEIMEIFLIRTDIIFPSYEWDGCGRIMIFKFDPTWDR